MPFLAIRTPLKLAACAAIALLVVSCTSSRPSSPQKSAAIASKPGLDIDRAHKDGAPWWDVDVSRIPDATPTLHSGPYKANPYTVLGKTYFPMQSSKPTWLRALRPGMAPNFMVRTPPMARYMTCTA